MEDGKVGLKFVQGSDNVEIEEMVERYNPVLSFL